MASIREIGREYIGWLYSLQRARVRTETDSSVGRPAAASEATAVLAQMRRGLGRPPGSVAEAFRPVARFLPENASLRDIEAFCMAGSLFAYHSKGIAGPGRRSLGSTLREAGAHETAEKRFIALLDCPWRRLDGHLRQVIGIIRSKDLAVDYRQLLRDLLDWEDPHNVVQLRWAGDYWRNEKPGDAAVG